MKAGLDRQLLGWIETFSCRQQHDLLPQLKRPDGSPALHHQWGQRNRPDWDARGLVIWPRGGQLLRLSHSLQWPLAWGEQNKGETIRLALRWWLEVLSLELVQLRPWVGERRKPVHLYCDARSTPPRVAAVLVRRGFCITHARDRFARLWGRDGKFYYSDAEPPSSIMNSFTRRGANQIMCLEILSIAFGALRRGTA